MFVPVPRAERRTMTAVALLTRALSGEQPSRAVRDLCSRGEAQTLLPELVALAADHDPVHRHKNLFEHSLAVLDNAVALESHSFLGEVSPMATAPPDLTLRMAALLHDVGKPATRVVTRDRVTFHGHDVVGARLVRRRLRRQRAADLADSLHRHRTATATPETGTVVA